jgi:hypothetical protein
MCFVTHNKSEARWNPLPAGVASLAGPSGMELLDLILPLAFRAAEEPAEVRLAVFL